MAKAIYWRVVGTLDTTILAWIITGSIELGAMIGGVEVITKTILYYFHDRVWYSPIKFGVRDD